MDINLAIEFLDTQISDANKGLPEEVFLFTSRITPMINIDLLIRDEEGRILLAWRNDEFCGRGWHIPGRIIRFKESPQICIERAALKEIGTIVEYNSTPIAISNIINIKSNNRGHFISLLYECKLSSIYTLPNKQMCENEAGYLKWHWHCPKDFLDIQKMYRTYFNEE